MRKIQVISACLLTVFAGTSSSLLGGEPEKLSDAESKELHRLIVPKSGESRWMEVEWYPNIWEARKKAAAEGKPLFLMAGSGGAPAAGC